MFELQTRTIKHVLSWERGAFSIKILTSLARSATLGDTSLARLTTELIICLRIRGAGHRTFQFETSRQMFRLGWGHRTNSKILLKQRGGDTAHSN